VSIQAAMKAHSVQRLYEVSEACVQGLSKVLIDCVDGGASVSFMAPLPMAKALDYWRSVAAGVSRSERALLVAEDADGPVSTVQLILDQPENQPHRADLSKMLVHRRARRQGVGAALLRVGVIPGYALLPQGGLCDTTFFYRAL
jgi:GNAT superfamily N-acetyltransferase